MVVPPLLKGFSGLEPICYAPIIDDEHSQYLTFTVSDVVNTEKTFKYFSKNKWMNGILKIK